MTEENIIDMLLEALNTDGKHHKQWYLAEILKKITGEKRYKHYREANWTFDEGIAP